MNPRQYLLTFALAVMLGSGLVAGCSDSDDGAVQVGEPCVPPPESDAASPGFSLSDSSAYQVSECGSGVCLVNHFQGRVTCPNGQGPRTPCNDDGDCSGGGETCTFAHAIVTGSRPAPLAPWRGGKALTVAGAMCGWWVCYLLQRLEQVVVSPFGRLED